MPPAIAQPRLDHGERTAKYAKQLDKLVRKIAGDTEDPIPLERARAIAQSVLELARVRRAKVALIERASAFGELDPPRCSSAVDANHLALKRILSG
jgi:hypothetical protein